MTGSSFDTETLNYLLPGLFKHYGSINKDLLLKVEFLSVDELSIFENEQVVRAFVNVRAELFVISQNLDKTNQLVMRADLKGAHANLTINIGEGITNTIYFQI